MTASTAAPAFTISITLRGRERLPTNSAKVCAPNIRLPGCAATNSRVTSVLRLNTLTAKPRLSTFSTRFWPITARPMRPKSFITLGGSLRVGTSAIVGPAAAQAFPVQGGGLPGNTSLNMEKLFHADSGGAIPAQGTYADVSSRCMRWI